MPRKAVYGLPGTLAFALVASFSAPVVAAPETENDAVASAAQAQDSALSIAADYGDVGPLETAMSTSSDQAFVALARVVLASSELHERETQAALAAYFATGDLDKDHWALGWSMVAAVAFAAGDYGGAARAAQQWLALLAKSDPRHQASGATKLLSLAAILDPAPRLILLEQHPTITQMRRDAAGLWRADMLVNGIRQDAVLDTGANLPVVSLSTAKRLHLKMLEGNGTIGSASRETLAVRVALAERLELAGSSLRQVPFLVLDDQQLELPRPAGYRIDAIIGFPVFRAIGRVTFAESGTLAVGFADTNAMRLGNLRVLGNSVFVNATFGGIPTALQLDTGAAESSLSPAFARIHQPLTQDLEQTVEHSAGAGGSTQQTAAIWRSVPVSVGGGTTQLSRLNIELQENPDAPTRNMGYLGQDILRSFSSFTLDLGTMSLTAGPPITDQNAVSAGSRNRPSPTAAHP